MDARDRWDIIRPSVLSAVNKKCQIESGQLSPDGQKLALAVEVKSLLGLRTQHAAMLYSLNDNAILGHVAVVKRDGNGGFRQATASSGAVLPFRRHKEKTDLLK
jgi:hypothetical protein